MNEPRVYNGKWDRQRRKFLAVNPLCAMCRQQGRAVAAAVVDHIIPHRLKEALKSGNPAQIAAAQKLFWDQKNWQGLCVPHHSSTKQRIERRGRMIGCDENGMPLEPGAHWNKQREGG